MLEGSASAEPSRALHVGNAAWLDGRAPMRSVCSVRVQECLSSDVVTVRADATLRDLHALLRRYDVSVVPVVARDADGRMRKVVGVATRADLLKALLGAKSLRALDARLASPVSSIARTTFTLRPSDRIADALDRMSAAGLPALPVVDGGRLVGIVAISDLLARCATGLHAVDLA